MMTVLEQKSNHSNADLDLGLDEDVCKVIRDKDKLYDLLPRTETTKLQRSDMKLIDNEAELSPNVSVVEEEEHDMTKLVNTAVTAPNRMLRTAL